MKEPMYECHRFDKCAVNNCPLHLFYPDLVTIYGPAGDPETKCTVSKARRLEIASRYPGVLRYGGRKRSEASAEVYQRNGEKTA